MILSLFFSVKTSKFSPEIKKLIIEMHRQGIDINNISSVLKMKKKLIRRVLGLEKSEKQNHSASLLASMITGMGNGMGKFLFW